MAGSLILWTIAYIPQPDGLLPWAQRLLNALIFLGVTVAASAQLSFALSYTHRIPWTPRLTLVLLAVIPLLTQLLYWIKPAHDLFFVHGAGPAASGSSIEGIWTRLLGIYIFSIVGASILPFLDAFRGKPQNLFPNSWILPVGAALPLITQLLNIIDLQAPASIDPSLFAYTLAAIGFSYGLLRLGPVASVAATREAVVEEMEDGWMVLDPQKNIVDMNPAAERMIGISREKAYGQPVHSIVDLSNAFESTQELEMKRSFKSQEGWRYLNIRISSLVAAKDGNFGHLIVWRDITERRLAEDARHRARDEMFVLINAISSEASQAMNLEEFLSESIYQIIYPFRSQIVAIFVSDEKKQENEDQTFYLNAHFGLSGEAVNSMPYLSSTSAIFSSVHKNRQPLLIEDPAGNFQLPSPMRETGSACMLVIPLMTQTAEESRIIGCIFLGRKEKPAYSQDEIVRLSTITDHLANLIDSERRRKLAIALSERQRLMRDLHDSVSQKLYGLVTLTEVAQASFEAGTPVDPSEILKKIGENARQAVKEMRLFLYQMQPIDLEKDGLISALHHRLAAVEGRADMKAGLIADENVSLSTDKEIALYFIAQEALNNILRHAKAKNIMVTLKQGRKNVILEIEDDGRGFDPKNLDRGGLGLPNMSERTSKIRGKLKILSRPGQGTRIIVTVPREVPVAPSRNRR
jgi:PAS domain S-box-containing protein